MFHLDQVTDYTRHGIETGCLPGRNEAERELEVFW
jgi:hypothetical protein